MRQKFAGRWVIVLVGTLMTAIMLVAGYIVYLLLTPVVVDDPTGSVAFVQEGQYNGITVIDPAQPMPDFTLTDQYEEAIQLSDLAGKPTLITFGFTNCPDICPFTLSEYRQIHEELGTQAQEMNFVFISVDGERDTPDVLRDYFAIQRVDDFIVGMTGNEASLRALSSDYGLEFIYGTANDRGWYTVDHTAGSFLLDGNQQWIRRYSYGTDRDLIVEDLRAILG